MTVLNTHESKGFAGSSARAHYGFCGVVKDIADFRALKVAKHLDLATDEIVARYHPDGKDRPIQKITDLFPLLTESKRRAAECPKGKRLFIYRKV